MPIKEKTNKCGIVILMQKKKEKEKLKLNENWGWYRIDDEKGRIILDESTRQ